MYTKKMCMCVCLCVCVCLSVCLTEERRDEEQQRLDFIAALALQKEFDKEREREGKEEHKEEEEDDDKDAPSTPKASFGFDPVHGNNDEYRRAVMETVMKAKLMTERIESKKKKKRARRGTTSKPSEAYADSMGTENAGIGMADAGPGIVAKLRSILERATHAATATTLKLSHVEVDQGTQQLLLHAAMQRQAELLCTLETIKAEAAQSKEETTAVSNRLAAALTELEKSQADVSDEHAKLRADCDRLAARVESLEREASERRRDAEAHRRYRSAEQHKSRGNSLFHTKKYQEAHDEYTLGIEAAASAGSDGDGSDGDSRLKAMLHSNRAAASQHLGRYCDAIVDCCIALEVDASYTRALQRRAEAFIAMQHYEGAFADLGRLAQLGDAEAAASLPEARRRARRSAELDHYAVLNLPANATNAQIKSSYKQLALRLHPDKAKTGGEREAADCLFRHVAEAHRVLASPGKRRRFDAGKMLSRTSRSGHHSHHHH